MASSTLQPFQEASSVVFIGSFNPMIFQPSWFSDNDLMAESLTSMAEEVIITRELSIFVVSNIHVQVELGRFSLTTSDASMAPVIRDIAVGCFSVLEHTPLDLLGMNLDSTFESIPDQKWDKMTSRFAPSAPWDSVLEKPQMRVILMEGRRAGCNASKVTIRVQPQLPSGCLVAINQHYVLGQEERTSVQQRNENALRALQDDWQSFRTYAQKAAPKLIMDVT